MKKVRKAKLSLNNLVFVFVLVGLLAFSLYQSQQLRIYKSYAMYDQGEGGSSSQGDTPEITAIKKDTERRLSKLSPNSKEAEKILDEASKKISYERAKGAGYDYWDYYSCMRFGGFIEGCMRECGASVAKCEDYKKKYIREYLGQQPIPCSKTLRALGLCKFNL